MVRTSSFFQEGVDYGVTHERFNKVL